MRSTGVRAGEAAALIVAQIVKNAGLYELTSKHVVTWRQTAVLVLSLLTGMTLGSCALSPGGDASFAKTSPEAREAVVRKAILERWDAMIKGDYDTAYDMMSKASRATVSRDAFKASTRHGFTSVRIESLSCNGDTCRDRVVATYNLRDFKGMPGQIDEVWIFENGRPWYVYRR